jgi:hypothetical protein
MEDMHTKLQSGNLQEREHLNGLGKIKLKQLFFGIYSVRIWYDAVRGKGH